MYQEIHHSLQLADPNEPVQNHTVKLCTCNKCHKHSTDICFYVPFCIIFVCLGIIQIISGVFYFFTAPVIKLIFNIAIGCWAILCGISGSMVACVCPSKPRKHELLLYCSLSILVLNIINLILLEFGQVREIFNDQIQKIWSKEFDLLESQNGRFITTYSAVLSIIVAFIETQINFCFLSHSQTKYNGEKFTRKSRCGQKYIDNDQTADLEYVIPKKNEVNSSRKPSLDTTVQIYAKSWVFEGTGEEEFRRSEDSSSISICSSPTKKAAKKLSHINQMNNHQRHTSDSGRMSKISGATSERFNQQMSSFSRCATPSPIPNSGQITPTNMNYSDYLDATYVVNHTNTFKMHKLLTVDYMPPTELIQIFPNETTVTSSTIQKSAPKYTSKTVIQNSNGPSSVGSSQQDDSQYASMLAELEQSLNDKKALVTTSMSPDDTSLTASTDKFGSSKSSSKDLEFSKELEAALQLIQDLETPSEGAADVTNPMPPSKLQRSESEKTLSAAVSLPSPEQMPYTMKSADVRTSIQTNNGKQHYRRKNVIHIEPSSQSTSGYSSPNSFSSNAQLSHTSATQNSIYLGDQANIVRIYIDPNGNGSDNNENGEKINSNLLTKGHILNANNLIDTIDQTNSLNVSDSLNKSYLLFKKRSKLMPHTDFQNRIFKSECLAYLTDDELVARHKCNRDVIRKIEQNVAQKIRGSPRYSEFNA